jgi:parallel beta-helix repeat protein
LGNKYGIFLWTGSSKNTILYNLAQNNTNGISLNERISNLTIANNIASYNNQGIILTSTTNTTVANNTVSFNIYTGISLWLSNNNTLFGNNLFHNIDYEAGCWYSTTGNIWYSNYYGNYTAKYPDATMIGDHWNTPYQPYQYSSSGINIDPTPMVRPTVEIPALDAPGWKQISLTSTSGNITLSWTAIECATSYKIYRSSVGITSVSGLTPISTLTRTSYIDTNLGVGVYNYVVVAQNFAGDSPLSNNIVITVVSPSNTSISTIPTITTTNTTTSTNSSSSSTTTTTSEFTISGYPMLGILGCVALGVCGIRKRYR